jgi:hypothetical protein
MDLDEEALRAVPDGGTLLRLPNGIEIVRRLKHEPIEMEGPAREELADRTNKFNGSKFLPGTTLREIVGMTAEVLRENGAGIGSNAGYNTVYDKPIGIADGKQVRGLRVLRSGNGRYAHAFPANEEEL